MEVLNDYLPKFQRTNMEGFPNVFKECECKCKADPDKSVSIKIQEVPEDMYEQVVEFMVKYYLPDEPLARSINMADDELSIMTFKYVLNIVLKMNLSLVAVAEDGQLVGCLLYSVASTGDPKPPLLPGDSVGKMMKMFYDIKTPELLASLQLDQHLQDMGFCVHPSYRGWGMGQELLGAGSALGALIGVQNIVTLFTAVNAQVLAERVGYTLVKEVRVEDIKDEDGNLVFPGEGAPEVLKLMMWSF